MLKDNQRKIKQIKQKIFLNKDINVQSFSKVSYTICLGYHLTNMI